MATESAEQPLITASAETSATSNNRAVQRVPTQQTPSRRTRTFSNDKEQTVHVAPFSLQRARRIMFHPERKVGAPPPVLVSIKAILTASWLNVLLIFIPVSWATHFVFAGDDSKATIIFVFSFLAIIPLAKLLAFATDELSMRVGQTLAGLINATLGNAVELIVAIIALTQCQLRVVQSSLIGSILSNLLLVLGMCFFAGGTRFREQGFGATATQINSSLLTISVIAVILPAAFHFVDNPDLSDPVEASEILKLSHGVALILLFIYASYLVFQLFTHATMYEQTGEKSTPYKEPDSAAENGAAHRTETSPEEEEEEETPMLSLWMTIALLVVVTVVVAVTAEWLVDSINGMTATSSVSLEFVGIVLLPIVGNAAEHVTAVTVSVKDKLTLSIGVAVGSSIQIALFVIPFMVTLGWIIGKPLTLFFDPYESIALFLAVMTVNYVVQDGKSNWLEGMILMCLYVILAVTFWFYNPAPSLGCS